MRVCQFMKAKRLPSVYCYLDAVISFLFFLLRCPSSSVALLLLASGVL